MKRKRLSPLPIMLLDWELCLRIERGDEKWAAPSKPYHCPSCCLTAETFSAKVRFDGSPVPLCEDHDPPLQMEELR